jgi:hypothetical protein
MLCALSQPAAAYTEDLNLEQQLSDSDPRALALLPAKGFKDGAAGFFRVHDLYVVPGSQRAWCSDRTHGVLKPGCYIELFIQGKGMQVTNARGEPCGIIGRWHRAPGDQYYGPTLGPFISKAIADGDWDRVESAIYQDPPPSRVLSTFCDKTIEK